MKKLFVLSAALLLTLCVLTACNGDSGSGLYDADGKLLASWSELTETYGLDIQRDYTHEDSTSLSSHLGVIMDNNSELAEGTKLVIDSSVSKIGSYALASLPLTEIEIPLGVVEIGSNSMRNTDIEHIKIPEGVTVISEMAFDACDSLKTVELPSTLISIESFGFGMCYSLTEINLPENLTTVGDRAFLDCYNMKSVSISKNVSSIGYVAFANCGALESITVDPDNPSYKSIDGNLYTKDGSALVQYAIGKQNTDFTLPEGVTTIEKNAFFNAVYLKSVTVSEELTTISDWGFWSCTSLEAIILNNNLASIGNYAFHDCDSLARVYYSGSEEEWESISIGEYNYRLTDAEFHFD